jgi:hypothetical protein
MGLALVRFEPDGLQQRRRQKAEPISFTRKVYSMPGNNQIITVDSIFERRAELLESAPRSAL